MFPVFISSCAGSQVVCPAITCPDTGRGHPLPGCQEPLMLWPQTNPLPRPAHQQKHRHRGRLMPLRSYAPFRQAGRGSGFGAAGCRARFSTGNGGSSLSLGLKSGNSLSLPRKGRRHSWPVPIAGPRFPALMRYHPRRRSGVPALRQPKRTLSFPAASDRIPGRRGQ